MRVSSTEVYARSPSLPTGSAVTGLSEVNIENRELGSVGAVSFPSTARTVLDSSSAQSEPKWLRLGRGFTSLHLVLR